MDQLRSKDLILCKALAIFQNGMKTNINADLSASYNIAARLHIKNIKNSLSEKKDSTKSKTITSSIKKVLLLPRDCIIC